MSTESLTAYERLEIALRYAVPILKDLEGILGEDVLRGALETRRQQRIEAARANAVPVSDLEGHREGLARGFEAFAAGDILDYDVIASDAASFDVDVKACGYARLMTELDARELGSILVCGEDDVWAAGTGLRLERTQTHMRDGRPCDFRFRPATTEAQA